MRTLLLVLTSLAIALPAFAQALINVNSASADELDTLPGIGPSKAAAIIQHREENGPFADLNALDAVPGIGPATLANLSALVIFEDGGAPAESAESSSSASSSTSAASSSATASAGAIDINSATADQLTSLPGIGPSKAAAIVSDREANGPFASCSDLSRVKGVGAATVSLMEGTCTAN